MSNGIITFANSQGRFDLEVTTFQMAVLFCWESRRHDSLTMDNLKLATELPESELKRTLWQLVAMPKLKRQILLVDPPVSKPTEFNQESQFRINQVRSHGIGALELSDVASRMYSHYI